MELTKTVTWTTTKGNKMEAAITITKEMRTVTAYADGWNIELSKKELFEMMVIEVSTDGKFIGRTHQEPSVVETGFYMDSTKAQIKAMGGYALICDKVVLKEAVYNEIMDAIATINETLSQDEEVAVAEEAKVIEEAKEMEEAVADAEHYKRMLENGYCPKCHSYCYGDCESD